MNLFVAELSELTLALRRDEEYIQSSIEQLSSLFKTLFGDLAWIRCYKYFPYVCRFLYYSATNLYNLQTPGEEYIQLVQVSDQQKPKPVSLLQRCLFIIFETFGDVFLQRFIKFLRSTAKDMQRQNKISLLSFKLIVFLLEAEHFKKFYKALYFAFHLKYASYSRYFSGISYLSLRAQSNEQISKLFTLIGFSIFAQFLITFGLNAAKEIKQHRFATKLNQSKESEKCLHDEKESNFVCTICSLRRFPVCTPCGHTFCWDCVIDYATADEMRPNYGRCPNCRIEFVLSRVVPLMNF